MNGLFRIESTADLQRVRQDGQIVTTPTIWPPYSANQVVLLLEGNDVFALYNRYAETIAKSHKVQSNTSLYMLNINRPSGQIENDRSASGWPESRAHFGDIPNSCVSIIGEGKVTVVRSVYWKVSPLCLYKTPLSL